MRIGIMQGRLLPPIAGRIQAFPGVEWRREFEIAANVGLESIEWIFEVSTMSGNPLGHDQSATLIRDASQASRVAVASVCADWFMERPLLRGTLSDRAESERTLELLIERCHHIGIERVVLPFVDASAIRSELERMDLIALLGRLASDAAKRGIELHLETDLGPSDFGRLLDRIPASGVKVNYDSGNSASLGYRVQEEFGAYGARIGSVHVKDRMTGGGTVPLGEGDADFEALFAGLAGLAYNGDLILQVARGNAGAEALWAQANLAFVRRYLTSP
jgi:L-ribulose-5-phosphate 3-epimerase